jgi:hypothetical protein
MIMNSGVDWPPAQEGHLWEEAALEVRMGEMDATPIIKLSLAIRWDVPIK